MDLDDVDDVDDEDIDDPDDLDDNGDGENYRILVYRPGRPQAQLWYRKFRTKIAAEADATSKVMRDPGLRVYTMQVVSVTRASTPTIETLPVIAVDVPQAKKKE